jgi:hypothetical protein
MHAPTQTERDTTRLRDPQHLLELITRAFAGGSYDAITPLAQFIDPQFVGRAPQSPDAHGPAGWLSFFARLYSLAPDLKGEVLRSAAAPSGDSLYVELRLSGTLKGQNITVDVCDHITLRNGLITARVTYFDPLPLLLTALSHPTAWPALLRLRFGRDHRKS